MEGEDPAGQWEWLEGVLNKSRSKNETVSLQFLIKSLTCAAQFRNQVSIPSKLKKEQTKFNRARYCGAFMAAKSHNFKNGSIYLYKKL